MFGIDSFRQMLFEQEDSNLYAEPVILAKMAVDYLKVCRLGASKFVRLVFLISELLTLIIKVKSCPSTLSYIFYLRYKIVQKQMFNRLITQLGNRNF